MKKDVSPQIIGTTEQIILPDFDGLSVPAKIDTGADSSAIWASSIEENDGELSYILFDVSSEFYTGKIIKTRDYSIVRIKNSFGKL